MLTEVIQPDGDMDEIIHNIPQRKEGMKESLFECCQSTQYSNNVIPPVILGRRFIEGIFVS